MIELRTLGSLELRGANGETLESVLVQPKRVALLAYLALARPHGFHRRDVLLGLFWPESDAPRARDALNQSLRFLRRALGKDVLISRGDDELGVDMTRLCCDAAAFEERIGAGDDVDALALYRGHLLDGVFISEAPVFERWVDGERTRLHELACGAARRLADGREAIGDLGDALHWARRALGLAPYGEPALRRLLELLDRSGDRASAVREYEAFAARLSQELEVEPSPETLAVVEGIRARATPSELPRLGRATPLLTTLPELGAKPDVARKPRWLRRRAWFALGLLLAGTAAWVVTLRRRGGEELIRPDPNVVAVLPFRVTGADAQLSYLREGMVDLLSTKLTGTDGPRAVDSRTLLAAWKRAARSQGADLSTQAAVELARTLGSGRVLLGEVVGVPSHVVLTATLLDVPAGHTTAQASVEGPADSLTALVDRLAVHLQALESGSDADRLAALMSTSLPALRAYLEGQSLYRRGSYAEAIARFQQALEHDSAFALAALGMAYAGGWVDLPAQARGRALAWAVRDRLSKRHRAWLRAAVGDRYPLPQTGVERIEDVRALLRLAPDQPEAWYALGDALFHFGRYVGEEAPEHQAIHAFQQAFRLDSTFAGPMHHLIPMLAERGDTSAVRRLGRIYFAVDSVGEAADYLRWRVAAGLRDEAALQAFWNRVNSASDAVLGWVLGAIQKESVRPEDFDRALAAFEPRGAWWPRAMAMLNRGRPDAAASLLERRTRDPASLYPLEQIEIFNTLFWDGDAARGARAAMQLARVVDEPVPAEPGVRRHYFAALCTVERWRVWHGQLETVTRSVERLRGARMPPDAAVAVEAARLCALELEAEEAVQRHRPEARRLVAILDSASRTGPYLDRWTSALNLSLARLLEAEGDRVGALAAVRRGTPRDIAPQIALSSFLREEGRLAALTGERESAIQAYRHYLALRSEPEPSLRPQVEQVRAALATLTGERRP